MAKTKATAAIAASGLTARSAFLKGADAHAVRGQGARWSHEDVAPGAAIMGRLVGSKPIKFKDGKDGEALVFSPAVELTNDGEAVPHRSIETINSAVLAQKIIPANDKGVCFAIEYAGRESSSHAGRSQFKQFLVAEVSPDTLREELRSVGADELVALLATVTD